MAIVAGIVVLAGLAGFWYLDRASKQTPAGPPPPSAEARAYAKNLRFVADGGVMLENPKMESHESYLKQSIVEISGNILNAGDRPLNSVEVTWLFKDPGTPMPDGHWPLTAARRLNRKSGWCILEPRAKPIRSHRERKPVFSRRQAQRGQGSALPKDGSGCELPEAA